MAPYSATHILHIKNERTGTAEQNITLLLTDFTYYFLFQAAQAGLPFKSEFRILKPGLMISVLTFTVFFFGL